MAAASPVSDLSPLWPEVSRAISAPSRRADDLKTLCGFGGRFAGTDSEKTAVAWLKERIREDFGRAPEILRLPYDDWQRKTQRLRCLTPREADLACHALVWSPPADGLEAEVVDLGRGTPDEIAARADEVRGRVALVRHEYMFSSQTVHRRAKYDAARAAGAVGFLIASHIPGEKLVTGSSGRNGPDDIPAAAITQEGAAALQPADGGHARIRLDIEIATADAVAESLLFELPGKRLEWVVLSAHIDGHPLAQSAMDNATGLAAVLDIARALAPHMDGMERGLRVCLFTVEEWALAGSGAYLDAADEDYRAAMRFNLNLDSIAGDPTLTALTSGFPAVERFVAPVAEAVGVPLGLYRPLMRNSDHYHFARHGIPAMRLVAGFDDPDSNLRFVLTPEDTLDKIDPEDFERATRLAAAIALQSCAAPELDLRNG